MSGGSSRSDDLRLQVTELQAKLNLMLAMRSLAENELTMLRSSTSWRITAPLRAMNDWIRKRI